MKTRHSIVTAAVAGWLWLGPTAELRAEVYTFSTVAGNPLAIGIDDQTGWPIGGYADGTNGNALFNFPQAVAVDGAGSVFVADTLNSAIRKLTRVGTDWVVTTVAGQTFSFPLGVAADAGGNLYVADAGNYTIRKITPTGSDWVVTTIAGVAGSDGTNDGPGNTARFSWPVGVAVDAATNIFVADYGVEGFGASTIRKLKWVGTNWVVSTIAGAYQQIGSADGTNGQARFNGPSGIAADSAGRLYVSDSLNSTVRQITPVGTNYVVRTLVGEPLEAGWADGTNSDARFSSPLGGIGVDSAGKLYVTDAGMVRKITPHGTNWVVTTIAGSYGVEGWVDGTGSAVQFFWPQAVAADSAGNLYVADARNNAIRQGALPPVTALPPSLEIVREENRVIVSWPLSLGANALQTVSAVPGGGVWMPLTNGVAVSGDRCMLTNALGPQDAFYRLRP
jgi:hypothetical protein